MEKMNQLGVLMEVKNTNGNVGKVIIHQQQNLSASGRVVDFLKSVGINVRIKIQHVMDVMS